MLARSLRPMQETHEGAVGATGYDCCEIVTTVADLVWAAGHKIGVGLNVKADKINPVTAVVEEEIRAVIFDAQEYARTDYVEITIELIVGRKGCIIGKLGINKTRSGVTCLNHGEENQFRGAGFSKGHTAVDWSAAAVVPWEGDLKGGCDSVWRRGGRLQAATPVVRCTVGNC